MFCLSRNMRGYPLLEIIMKSIIKRLFYVTLQFDPLGLWPIFFNTFLTPGCERCEMMQELTYLFTDINKTGP